MDNENPIEGLSLDQFVSLAITDISKGMRQAAQELVDEGVLINPLTNEKGAISMTSINTVRHVQHIDFDLTVSAISNEQTGAGIQIRVLNLFNAGGKIDAGTSNTTTSRMKFSIPISFPTNDKILTRRQARQELPGVRFKSGI